MFIKETGYYGQLKSGPICLRKQEKIDLKKDAGLVKYLTPTAARYVAAASRFWRCCLAYSEGERL